MTVVNFIETPRFSDDVAYGMSGGPTFKTSVVAGHTGVEQRNIEWSKARRTWSAGVALKASADMVALRDFFFNAQGKFYGFRFRDWLDYVMTAHNVGTGDGATTQFAISKTYTYGAYTYVRRITKVVSGTELVYVNGVLMAGAGVDYTFYPNTGYIVFTVAPTNTHPITLTCEFDVPVRFDNDEMFAAYDGYDSQAWEDLKLVEVSLEIENAITGPA